MNQNVTIIMNDKCWMEQTAINQLNHLATLPGFTRAAGLPDLHAGKSPIGIAVETRGILYPHLVGSDIGCGMGLFDTGIPMRKYKQERFVTRLNHIRALEDLPTENPYPEESPILDLGTIGSGNHFAEFQAVEETYLPTDATALGLDRDRVYLLIHSGSRSYGQRILSQYLDFGGLAAGSEAASAYLEAHADALLWARRNRALVAEKLVDYLGFGHTVLPLLDCCHNYVEAQGETFLHRKGAVSALDGLVVLPGSRGSLTYIMKPAADTEKALYSLSHGAGRKWARSLCKSRIRDKYDRDSIRSTKLKSRVVCHDTELLFQETPEAYKNIDQVVSALVEHGLADVVATLRPLITYKG